MCTGIRELMQEAIHEAARVIDENHELLRIILREGLAGDPAGGLPVRPVVG